MTRQQFVQKAIGTKVTYEDVFTDYFTNPAEKKYYDNLSNSSGVITRVTNTDFFNPHDTFKENFSAAKFDADFQTEAGKVTVNDVNGYDLVLDECSS